jgi:anti-sigma-K factor RskA
MLSEVENHVIDMLPGYVVDALTDEETGQVAKHLAGCQSCQAEFARLQQVADDLPLALVQTAPPPRVKDQLMGSIHARQPKVEPFKQPTGWQKLISFIRQPLPAFALTLIVLMAVGNLLLWRQLTLTSQRTNTPMRVVALANTQNAPGAMGTLIMDVKGDYGTLVVDNLAMLASSEQYQVWLTKDGQRVSGGIFSVNPDGYASLEILAPAPLVQYDSVGITVEPYGGSPGPTGAKVLGGTLAH